MRTKLSRIARSRRCLTEEGCHRVPARGALVHGPAGGDLLKRTVGRGRGDAGDEPDQPIIAALLGSAIQQLASTIPSDTSRRTVRRSRSAVQPASGPRFRTRTTSPQGC